jgi:hypothetical protein
LVAGISTLGGHSRVGAVAKAVAGGLLVLATTAATAGAAPTPSPADTMAPRITTATVSPGRSTATVAWQTDEAADSQVEFGPTPSYGSATRLAHALVHHHVRTLTGLRANRTYHYRIWTRDGSGHLTRSDDRTFRTRPLGPVPVIVDTDIFSDADDVGALATAFALQLRGEARVIAVGVNTRRSRPRVARSSWRCAAAVAQFYGAGRTPLGTHKPDNGTTVNTDEFAGPCARRASAHTRAPRSVVRVFRRALSRQVNGRAVIVETGYSQNLAALLASPPDDISRLTGRQLVARKVNRLVIMGGGYPSRAEENNLAGDPASAQRVADEWPTRVVWAGYEVGDLVHTGATISSTHPGRSPVRIAYEAFVGPDKWIFSYDLVAVFHAIRPANPMLVEVGPGSNVVDDDGGNQFTPGPGNDTYLRLPNPAVLSAALDDLLEVVP